MQPRQHETAGAQAWQHATHQRVRQRRARHARQRAARQPPGQRQVAVLVCATRQGDQLLGERVRERSHPSQAAGAHPTAAACKSRWMTAVQRRTAPRGTRWCRCLSRTQACLPRDKSARAARQRPRTLLRLAGGGSRAFMNACPTPVYASAFVPEDATACRVSRGALREVCSATRMACTHARTPAHLHLEEQLDAVQRCGGRARNDACDAAGSGHAGAVEHLVQSRRGVRWHFQRGAGKAAVPPPPAGGLRVRLCALRLPHDVLRSSSRCNRGARCARRVNKQQRRALHAAWSDRHASGRRVWGVSCRPALLGLHLLAPVARTPPRSWHVVIYIQPVRIFASCFQQQQRWKRLSEYKTHCTFTETGAGPGHAASTIIALLTRRRTRSCQQLQQRQRRARGRVARGHTAQLPHELCELEKTAQQVTDSKHVDRGCSYSAQPQRRASRGSKCVCVAAVQASAASQRPTSAVCNSGGLPACSPAQQASQRGSSRSACRIKRRHGGSAVGQLSCASKAAFRRA